MEMGSIRSGILTSNCLRVSKQWQQDFQGGVWAFT